MARPWRLGLHSPPAVTPVELASFFFSLNRSKIGIICVTGMQGLHLGLSQLADKMLCCPSRTAV